METAIFRLIVSSLSVNIIKLVTSILNCCSSKTSPLATTPTSERRSSQNLLFLTKQGIPKMDTHTDLKHSTSFFCHCLPSLNHLSFQTPASDKTLSSSPSTFSSN